MRPGAGDVDERGTLASGDASISGTPPETERNKKGGNKKGDIPNI